VLRYWLLPSGVVAQHLPPELWRVVADYCALAEGARHSSFCSISFLTDVWVRDAQRAVSALLAPTFVAGVRPKDMLDIAVTPNNTLLVTVEHGLVALVRSEQKHNVPSVVYQTQVLAGHVTGSDGSGTAAHVDGSGKAARFSTLSGFCVV
jgi:hypothetical protein